MRLLKQDMQNRTTSLDEQLKVTRDRIGGGSANTGTTVRMRAPNGQEQDVPIAQVAHYTSLGATVVKK
jgi:hypothetical protein